MPIKYKNLNMMIMMYKRSCILQKSLQLVNQQLKNELVLVSKQKYMVPYKKTKCEIILYNPTGS